MQVAVTEGFKPVVEALLAHNPDVEMEVGTILIYLIPVFKYTHLPTIKVVHEIQFGLVYLNTCIV